jgi:hypothetical protein
VLIAVQYYQQLDQTWLAIVVAILVGLGVRAMVSTSGHASYVRGALTGILALAAYFGGMQLYSQLAQRGVLAKELAPPVVADEEAEVVTETDSGESEAETVEAEEAVEPAAAAPVGRDAVVPRGIPVQQGSPLDYVWLIIGTLIAYELGRGSDPKAPKEPVAPPPDAT